MGKKINDLRSVRITPKIKMTHPIDVLANVVTNDSLKTKKKKTA